MQPTLSRQNCRELWKCARLFQFAAKLFIGVSFCIAIFEPARFLPRDFLCFVRFSSCFTTFKFFSFFSVFYLRRAAASKKKEKKEKNLFRAAFSRALRGFFLVPEFKSSRELVHYLQKSERERKLYARTLKLFIKYLLLI